MRHQIKGPVSTKKSQQKVSKNRFNTLKKGSCSDSALLAVRCFQDEISFACFAVLCVFALSIFNGTENSQRKDAKDRKAREGLITRLQVQQTNNPGTQIVAEFLRTRR
jgi:hypothetical protein